MEARQCCEEVGEKHNEYKRQSQIQIEELKEKYQILLESKEKEAQKYS